MSKPKSAGFSMRYWLVNFKRSQVFSLAFLLRLILQPRFVLMPLLMLTGLLVSWENCAAQVPDFSNKRIAIYFSMKNFRFDDSYFMALSQFVKANEGKDKVVERLKTETLVILATHLTRQLKEVSGADSVYFLNEFPNEAGTFMQAYSQSENSLSPIQLGLEGTDFVLVINPMILGSYKTSSVFVRSNRIYTDQIAIKTARMALDIFHPASGLRLVSTDVCLDENKTRIPEKIFDFKNADSPTGTFLAKLFSQGYYQLKEGIQSNCSDPDEDDDEG